MSDKSLEWDGYARLAESVASLLSEGTPMTTKEIAAALRRRGTYRGKAGGIAKALATGSEYYRFARLSDDCWTIPVSK